MSASSTPSDYALRILRRRLGLTFLAITQLRFLFHTLVTDPPFPAPRSANISKSSSCTGPSPSPSPFFFFDVPLVPVRFLVFEGPGAAASLPSFVAVLEGPFVSSTGLIGDEPVIDGLDNEAELSCSFSISLRSFSASDRPRLPFGSSSPSSPLPC